VSTVDIKKMKGWIDLDQVSAIVTEGDPEVKTDSMFKLLTVDGKAHTFQARDADDRKRWTDAITAQVHCLGKYRFATNLGKPVSEKVLRTAKFSRTNKGKSSSGVVACTNLNLRCYSGGSADSIAANMHKDCVSSIPLYLAYASVEGNALKFVDSKGEVTTLTPSDAAEPLKEWETLIMTCARESVERVVSAGGAVRAGCSTAVGEVDEYSVLTITSEGITIDILKTKAKIEVKEGDFKGAEMSTVLHGMFSIVHSATHKIKAPNAAGLCYAIQSAIAKHRKKKAKKGRSSSKAKRTGSTAVSKKPRASVAKKAGSKKLKKRITDADRARLKPLFEQYDTDKSGTIDKTELRNVIEASLKTKVTEKLMQKYLDAEFNRHDKDGSGSIDFEEFCELYSKLYLDPELPIVVSADQYADVERSTALETGENAPKVERREVTMTAAQKQEALEKFDVYDKDKSGEIDKEELMALLKDSMGNKMGPKILERFVDAQFQLGDTDGSGTIDKPEFIELYAKLNFAQQNGMMGLPIGGPSNPMLAKAMSKPLAPPPSLLPPPTLVPPPLVDVAAIPPPMIPPPLAEGASIPPPL
jgi:Ca2+-binding EF-hand superfamily protein